MRYRTGSKKKTLTISTPDSEQQEVDANFMVSYYYEVPKRPVYPDFVSTTVYVWHGGKWRRLSQENLDRPEMGVVRAFMDEVVNKVSNNARFTGLAEFHANDPDYIQSVSSD